MADIGDVYRVPTTIRDVDGDLVDPDTITLTVTDPSGATTTPAVANPSVGLYHADVAITSAGRWRFVWATTNPTGTEKDDYLDVRPDNRLLPLATVADIEARLGRALTTEESARVKAGLADASAAIRKFCRQDFDLVVGDTIILRPIGGTLRLPQRPVTTVTSVTAVGSNGLPDLVLPGWTFDGVDIVNIAGLDSGTFVSLPAWWEDYGAGIGTYRVVYGHGYAITPDDIKGKAAQMVMRVLTATTVTEGQTQMTVGQYTEQWQQATGSVGLTPVLTRADRQDLIDWGYLRTATTIQTRSR